MSENLSARETGLPTITLRIAMRTLSGDNAWEHWAVRSKRNRAYRQAVGNAWLEQVPLEYRTREAAARLLLPCSVTLTRVAPRSMDEDGLASSMKQVRDEIAYRLGLPVRSQPPGSDAMPVAEDRDQRVRWETPKQRKGQPKEYAVLVEIRARDPRRLSHCRTCTCKAET